MATVGHVWPKMKEGENRNERAGGRDESAKRGVKKTRRSMDGNMHKCH